MLKTYVRKPLEVQAIELTRDNLQDVANWLNKLDLPKVFFERNISHFDVKNNFWLGGFSDDGILRVEISVGEYITYDKFHGFNHREHILSCLCNGDFEVKEEGE
jgi:hypothetical protein